MSAAQPVSSLVVRQRAVRSSDDATSRVALATSMPTLEPSAMGLLSSDPSTVRARPCECELEIRSTVRALTVDRRTRRPSYTTVSEPKGLRATASVIERSKDTKGGCGGDEVPPPNIWRAREVSNLTWFSWGPTPTRRAGDPRLLFGSARVGHKSEARTRTERVGGVPASERVRGDAAGTKSPRLIFGAPGRSRTSLGSRGAP